MNLESPMVPCPMSPRTVAQAEGDVLHDSQDASDPTRLDQPSPERMDSIDEGKPRIVIGDVPAASVAVAENPGSECGSCAPVRGEAAWLTPWQTRKATQRWDLYRRAAPLVRGGITYGDVAPMVGASAATIWRVMADAAAAGLGPDATPEQWLPVMATGISPGRDGRHDLAEAEALALRALVLARSTTNRRHVTLAIEEFRDHAVCRPETRLFIVAELDRAARQRRLPRWPRAWYRRITPTRLESAEFRGPKHIQEVQMVDRRGMYLINETGERVPLAPHTIWEMDDMSDNEPRTSTDPDTGEVCLTRQTLWTQDVYSAAYLSFTQVARPKDAYRIEDVADHVWESVRDWGMPEVLRLEGGKIWAGKYFRGFIPDVAGWPDDERWGGLAPLIRVVNVHSSRGKGGIEASFDLQQAMAAHLSLSIGRSRGDYEAATNALLRVHRTGDVDSRFWTMTESSRCVEAVAERFNARPKVRRAHGRRAVVPGDLLADRRGQAVPASEAWRFLPIKRLATVRGGHLECAVEHYPQNFRFRVNGVTDLILDTGYRVLVAFHPGRPDDGCHVFNAELGTSNREGFKRGERILLAPFAEDAPQVVLGERSGDPFASRRKERAGVRRGYRAIQAAVQPRTVTQDSKGNRVEIGRSGGGPAGRASDTELTRGTAGRALALAPSAPRTPLIEEIEELSDRASVPDRYVEIIDDAASRVRVPAMVEETEYL